MKNKEEKGTTVTEQDFMDVFELLKDSYPHTVEVHGNIVTAKGPGYIWQTTIEDYNKRMTEAFRR